MKALLSQKKTCNKKSSKEQINVLLQTKKYTKFEQIE